jgi:hypothetical protein
VRLEDLVEDMKYLVVKTITSVRSKLNPDCRKGCFEILGFDFMIDADLTVWLIEVNTNPCLEESSSLLRILLPRMLDDAFKLTLDRQFCRREPKSSFGYLGEQSKRRRESNEPANQKPSPYPVEGYSSFANLWERVYDMQAARQYLRVQERRLRSPQTVYVSETHDLYMTTTESYRAYKDLFNPYTIRMAPSKESLDLPTKH